MITTIYTCDKCKSDFDKPDQMFDVSIHVNSIDNRYVSITHNYCSQKALWCRRCIDSIGLIGWPPVKIVEAPEKVPTRPTLEGMICEIVKTEMENSQ